MPTVDEIQRIRELLQQGATGLGPQPVAPQPIPQVSRFLPIQEKLAPQPVVQPPPMDIPQGEDEQEDPSFQRMLDREKRKRLLGLE